MLVDDYNDNFGGTSGKRKSAFKSVYMSFLTSHTRHTQHVQKAASCPFAFVGSRKPNQTKASYFYS